MLGAVIRDPLAAESDVPETGGLGLLRVATTFAGDKQTVRVRGRVSAGQGLFRGAVGLDVGGYEIHMGRTSAIADAAALLHITESSAMTANHDDGAVAGDGWIAGTYLHGLFENDALRHLILINLAERKGVARAGTAIRFDRGADYDRLAATVRASLDMDALRGIIGL
jgi:adenosylcobyric acid synthase